MGDLFNPNGFTFGLLAIFNACSFVLLPSYLALFLNLKSNEKSSTIQTLNRAQLVSVSMAGGFMTVLFLLGVVFTGAASFLGPLTPYISMVMGVALFFLGIAMLRGYELNIKLPEIGSKKTNDTSLSSMYIFGLSYAIASLGCAAPLFFALIATSSVGPKTSLNLGLFDVGIPTIADLGSFLSYGIGMGLSVTVVTLAVAFGKQSLVSGFKTIIPKLNRISAIFLLFIGPYVSWYGFVNYKRFEDAINAQRYAELGLCLRRGRGCFSVQGIEDLNASLSNWLSSSLSPKICIKGTSICMDIGLLSQPPRYVLFAIIFVLVNTGLITAGFIQRKSSRLGQPSDSNVTTSV